MQDLVMYEAHVRGFTADPSSGVAAPGTYAGMTERLDYLQELGVTAIELLPVFEFNELEYYTPIPGTDLYRYNFWGYSTVAFFAPMARFSAQVFGNANGCLTDCKSYRLVGLICPDNMLLQ
jgi:isoamylase